MIGADWEITKRCNQRCSFCLNSSGPEHKDILSTSECKLIIDQLVELGVFHLVITGGEPFVREDIVSILHYAASKNLIWTVTTNGSALNDELIKELLPLRSNFRSVQVSLHGLSKKTYESYGITSKELSTTKENIQKLVKAGFTTTVICLFNGENSAEVLDVYSWCRDHGVYGFISSQIKPSGRAIESFSSLKSSKYKWISILKDLYLTRSRGGGPELLISEPALFQKYANRKLNSSIINYSCPAGTETLMIKSNGDVYPCPFISEDCTGSIVSAGFKAGNVKEVSLASMLTTPAFLRFNENVSDAQLYDGGTDSKCKSCGEFKKQVCRPCQLAISDCHESVRVTTDFVNANIISVVEL